MKRTSLSLAVAAVVFCLDLSATASDQDRQPSKNPSLTCREALEAEARLLGTCIRSAVPDSDLAAGLDEFANHPVVTREIVDKLGEIRNLAHPTAPESMLAELKRAQAAVEKLCRTIESREQRAQDAVDQAIVLLAEKQYRNVLERFSPPDELTQMKASGHFESVVARFENGHGSYLLNKLRRARKGPPVINSDGTISFVLSGTLGPDTLPVVMVEIDQRWYFQK